MDYANIAIHIVAGNIAGNAVCAAMKQPALTLLSRTAIGAVGGVLGGLVFNLTGGASAVSGALVDVYTGGFGGAILTPIVGPWRQACCGHATSRPGSDGERIERRVDPATQPGCFSGWSGEAETHILLLNPMDNYGLIGKHGRRLRLRHEKT